MKRRKCAFNKITLRVVLRQNYGFQPYNSKRIVIVLIDEYFCLVKNLLRSLRQKVLFSNKEQNTGPTLARAAKDNRNLLVLRIRTLRAL